MDSGEKSHAMRGRARGRATGSVSPQPTDLPQHVAADQSVAEGAAVQVYQHMFVDRQSSGSDENGSKDNGGNGSNNGNGNNGGNGRGASPRDMPLRYSEAEMEEREKRRNEALLADYVVTRPSADFDKRGATHQENLPRPCVVANYFQMRNLEGFKMRMYSVKVEPETKDLKKVRQLVATKKEQLGSYICSGFVLYTTKAIMEDPLVFQGSPRSEPDSTYEVTINYTKDVSNTESVLFQFYNIVVRQIQQTLDFKLLGRHFFNPTARVPFPSWNLELWPGFQNSIRQQDGGLMLNVESVWKVLRLTSVLQIMGLIRNDHPHNYNEVCQQTVVGMTVITTFNNRAYKISRIDFQSSPRSTFESKDGIISYVDYYKKKHNQDIRIATQPMLVSEPRESERRRGQGDIYLVPEMCFPCGLNEELRSNFRLMKELAQCLHMPPAERVTTMRTFIRQVNSNPAVRALMDKWGLQVNNNPVVFDGRYLNSEPILVAGTRVTPDEKADWTNAFRSQRMLVSMSLSQWGIVCTSRDSQSVGSLVGTLQRVGGPLGYHIQKPEIFRASDGRGIIQSITDAMNKYRGKLDLLFIILPNNNADFYATVKKRCSIDFGIPSQCFLSKNLNSKGLMSICTKVVIQMNAKQGGEPWSVQNPLKQVMVVGYDVHHAGPGGGQSISAMCATISPSLGRYYSCVERTPTARQEVAPVVAKMFEKCLRAFKEKNGNLPFRVFVYRDGVGEGQLRTVVDIEVEAFKKRISEVYTANQQEPPKLTYIIVNKRINTRFFVRTHSDQIQNPRPGLIVDDMVTRPERYDFFLISQTARQGCVGPTYYNVIFDESGIPPDRIQMYTFKLCHLYYNWSGTVAVPAPCQNAHKLAFLVGTALKRPAHRQLDFLLHFL